MTEEWRPVVGHEGVYEVSDMGRIRSLDRVVHNGRGWHKRRGVFLNPWMSARYMRVQLGADRVELLLHVVVLEAFVGPRPEGSVCRHLDGDPTNNALSNLQWGTPSENGIDCVSHGTHHWARKTHCPQGHPYSTENTWRDKDGHRHCRACKRESWRRWYQKRQSQKQNKEAA